MPGECSTTTLPGRGRKVMDAAFFAALLYGCEAWIGSSMKQAHKLYQSDIRTLIGVRHSTLIDLCLLELNMPSLQAQVRSDQRRFIENLLEKHRVMCDDPFIYVWNLCRQKNTPAYKYYTLWSYLTRL